MWCRYNELINKSVDSSDGCNEGEMRLRLTSRLYLKRQASPCTFSVRTLLLKTDNVRYLSSAFLYIFGF